MSGLSPKLVERYSRQILFREVGLEGQQRLLNSRVTVCGCGALGSTIAELLTRAGVGFLRLIDQDRVEWTNLQRQVLFDEQDASQRTPKALCAAEKLRRINSQVTIEPIVAHIDHTNILDFCKDVDLILDGTDNFPTRFLINDASLKLNVPWVHGGCAGSHGQVMPIFPHQSACLRCLMGTVPESDSTDTCHTVGILGPTVTVIGALECVHALKILLGKTDTVSSTLTIVDLWDGTFRQINLEGLRERTNCPACVQNKLVWLSGEGNDESGQQQKKTE